MSNNKQSSVEIFFNELYHWGFIEYPDDAVLQNRLEKAKEMQQEQAQLYAGFVLKCVNNNLPPITFNDWINLENNEQQ
jgi:hypothetical protein